jgi:hypothetical protein
MTGQSEPKIFSLELYKAISWLVIITLSYLCTCLRTKPQIFPRRQIITSK